MPTADAEHAFGTGMLGSSSASEAEPVGSATVQLIDLSEIGAESTKPGKSLRVLANLHIGGSGTSLGPDNIILDGKRWLAWNVCNEGTWSNGELYLMSFLVEGDGSVTRYDVLLEQSTEPPYHLRTPCK